MATGVFLGSGGRARVAQLSTPAGDSVEWFIGYPAPLLVCVVDKKAIQIKVYQTTHRFAAAVGAELPNQITLTMDRAGEGRTLAWDDTGKYRLGPPDTPVQPRRSWMAANSSSTAGYSTSGSSVIRRMSGGTRWACAR